MGKVWRAHHTSLKRDDALKVLPDAFASDPERLSRFQREAQILAALNHTNITRVYGLEEADGSRALVMELVEGPTLADRIAAGPIPVQEVVSIARQVADALDAAHGKGIVHRDLKPANVKLTAGGEVKVLDFGLAKHVVISVAASELLTTDAHTRDGALIGTTPYMSPEQARGREMDKRTDIWAFGCLLYEMVTGRRAFERATVADTLAAIVGSDPDWSVLPSDLPRAVSGVIRRCLEKDPHRRLRDIGDVNVLLDDVFDPAPKADAAGKARENRYSRAIALVIAGVIVLTAAIVIWRAGSGAPVRQLSLGAIEPFTFDSGLTTDPSLSADGRLIAYASNRGNRGDLDIFVQQTTGGAAIRLTDDPADDQQPDVSPDGSLVAFRSERSPAGVYVASALGGQARLLAPDGRAPRFSPDGSSVAYEVGTSLAPIAVINTRKVFVVPANGGTPIQLAANLLNAGAPAWAPDGKSLMVLARKSAQPGEVALDWWRVPIDPGQAAAPTGTFEVLKQAGLRLVLDTVTIPYPRQWTPDGVLFSATSGEGETVNLWQLAFDAAGRPQGPPVRLTQGTTLDQRAAVSRDGRIVWAARTSVLSHFGFPIDAASGRTIGEPRKLLEDSAPSGRSSLSVDGHLLIFPRYEIASGILWARDLRTGEERQLVATPRTPLNPALSRDARWVGYTLTKLQTGGDAGVGDGYVVEATGGVPRKVCDNCEVSAWTTDGHLVFNTDDRKNLVRVNPQTGERHDLIDGPSAIDRPMFGPDGRWAIFNINGAIVHTPVYPDRAAPQAEWTTILNVGATERTAGISPDGGVLYVLLETDGFRCAYGLRLDPRTGLSRGEPFPVTHVHNSAWRWGTTGYGSAVGTGLFVASLYDTRGNIWMSQITRR
jgi:Tol biopolymer transport system component